MNWVSVIPQASSRARRLSDPFSSLFGEGGTVLAGQGVLSAVTGGVVVLGVGLSWQRKTHLFHCLDLEGMWWFDLAAQGRGVSEGTSEDPAESWSIHPQKVKRDWVVCPSRDLPPKNSHHSSPGAQGKRKPKRGYLASLVEVELNGRSLPPDTTPNCGNFATLLPLLFAAAQELDTPDCGDFSQAILWLM